MLQKINYHKRWFLQVQSPTSCLRKLTKIIQIIQDFLSIALKAYAKYATYMAEKLSLKNEFLKNIVAIDPIAITSQKSIVLKLLFK